MRTLIPLAGVLALATSVSVANAAQTTGTILKIDGSIGNSITLANGETFFLPDSVDLSALKVGEKVLVVFDEPYGKKTASAVVPAA